MPVSIQNKQQKLTMFQLPYNYHIEYEIPVLKGCKPLTKKMYNLFIERYRSSMSYGTRGINGKCFYNRYDHYYYVVFSNEQLQKIFHKSHGTISASLKELKDRGCIDPHYLPKYHFTMIELPRLANMLFKQGYLKTSYKSTTSDKSKGDFQKLDEPSLKNRHLVSNSNQLIKNRTGNTFNTENGRKATKSKSFKRSDPLSDWVDSAKHGGLTLGASNCIARFCSKNFKYNPENHCRRIYKIIDNARGHEIKQAHKKNKKINKDLIPFESNGKVISGLAPKLRKVFTKIINSNSNKLTINHYDKYLMTSLKNFFYDALGLKERKVVTPEAKVNHKNVNNHYYGKRKAIREKMPQWYYDEKNGKEKAKPSSSLLNKKNKANLDYLGAVDNSKVSKAKKIELKKQAKHYDKLWNDQQQSTKPTTKPKHHKQAKQPKGLKKTSKALHDKIQARLARLGEK